jgi:hypothetical protein
MPQFKKAMEVILSLTVMFFIIIYSLDIYLYEMACELFFKYILQGHRQKAIIEMFPETGKRIFIRKGVKRCV